MNYINDDLRDMIIDAIEENDLLNKEAALRREGRWDR